MVSSTRPIICSILVAILLLIPSQTPARTDSRAGPLEPNAIQPPVLKWQKGGCYSSWCETGWYSSPAVADLDGDGSQEVIGAAYSTVILTGTTGLVKRQIAPPVSGARAWPGVVVADVNADGKFEIVTAQGSGYVRVLDRMGNVLWTRQPASNELRSLAVYDLDGDGTHEIVVSSAISSRTNTWVYEHDGTLRNGWPQLNNDSGYAAGVYNANVALGDLDGDKQGEIVVPSDVHYICAYKPNGVQIPANAMYGGKGWGRVGIWESLATEIKGWGDCSTTRAERYRTNFAHGASVIADVNSDGVVEIVAVGNVYDCAVGHPPGKYNGVYLFNADRSRFNAGGFDWRTPPIDTGAPLSEDYSVIENNQPNPVVADLDGDGRQEIIFSSYDGRVHAFWLDKSEHYNWPYSIYNAGEGFYRFGSEPVVADLDNDGKAEVILASWPQKGGNRLGKLHILSYQGTLLQEVTLPGPFSGDWNGGLAAPTLANIDSDADLELVINTAHSGLIAYDLPGTANARILWGTGRGNYQRSGSILQGTLENSIKSANPARPGPGATVTYTILLQNPGQLVPSARVTDTLPSEVNYAGNLWALSGSYGRAGSTITWTGEVSGSVPVTITFNVTVSLAITTPQAIVNTVLINDGLGHVWQRQATVVANGLGLYLPMILK